MTEQQPNDGARRRDRPRNTEVIRTTSNHYPRVVNMHVYTSRSPEYAMHPLHVRRQPSVSSSGNVPTSPPPRINTHRPDGRPRATVAQTQAAPITPNLGGWQTGLYYRDTADGWVWRVRSLEEYGRLPSATPQTGRHGTGPSTGHANAVPAQPHTTTRDTERWSVADQGEWLAGGELSPLLLPMPLESQGMTAFIDWWTDWYPGYDL